MVQPRKTRPCITEILLMGGKGTNQTNTTKINELQTSVKESTRSAYKHPEQHHKFLIIVEILTVSVLC